MNIFGASNIHNLLPFILGRQQSAIPSVDNILRLPSASAILPSLPTPAGIPQARPENNEATMSKIDFKVADLLTKFTPDQIRNQFQASGLNTESAFGGLLEAALSRLGGATPAAAPAVVPEAAATAAVSEEGLENLLQGFGTTEGGNSAVSKALQEARGDVGSDLDADIDKQLAEAIQAPETATGFAKMFQSGEFRQLLLQTGLRMAQGQNFGESLAGGALAAQEHTAGREAIEAAAEQQGFENKIKAGDAKLRKEEQTIKEARLELDKRLTRGTLGRDFAQARKFDAETNALLDTMTNGGRKPITEGDYSKLYSEIVKSVGEVSLVTDEDSPDLFLDTETRARYLLNSSLPMSSRRYGTLKGVYKDQIKGLTDAVTSGTATQSELDSRIDEFMVAFGPNATFKYLKQLQGIE